MSDEIPDPTELRRKLGIAKALPAPVLTMEEYATRRIPQIDQYSGAGKKGVTLMDAEAEPREIDDAESAKIDEILKDCPPACAAWLKKYIVLGNPSAASRAINYSAGILSWWKRTHPPFKALYEFYHDEVRLRWNELSERKIVEGFRDEVFKPDGSLKFTRMRQDPQFLVQFMKKMDPDWKDDQLGTQITVNFIQEEE